MAQQILTADSPGWLPAGTPRWRRWRFVAGAAVVLLAIGYLVSTNLQQTMVYYLTVSEYVAQPSTYAGQEVRLAGTVVPGTIVRDDRTLSLQFMVTEGGKSLPVAYKGVVPDIFGDNVDVVLEGKLNSGGVFAAQTLLAKCPSKFEAQLHDTAGT